MPVPTYDTQKSPVRNLQLLLAGLISPVTLRPELTFETMVAQLLHRMHLTASLNHALTAYTADGAITLASGVHVIEKTSAAAMTVAAPSSQDGTVLTIISNTDFAHVITFTGSTLLDGTTGANLTVTMTAFKGSCIRIVARGTKWLLLSSSNVTSIV